MTEEKNPPHTRDASWPSDEANPAVKSVDNYSHRGTQSSEQANASAQAANCRDSAGSSPSNNQYLKIYLESD